MIRGIIDVLKSRCCRKDDISIHGPPEIMNTDQGSKFTGAAWITTLTEAGRRISMDGRGRYLDNIFIERLWRFLKQEAIYLEEINDHFQARRVVKDWIAFYNSKRRHSSLERRRPDDAYCTGLEEQKAAWNLNPIHLSKAAKCVRKSGTTSHRSEQPNRSRRRMKKVRKVLDTTVLGRGQAALRTRPGALLGHRVCPARQHAQSFFARHVVADQEPLDSAVSERNARL
ncbi:MAG: integrase core domain-containing protein [Pseudomonadota bacterium]